MDYAWGLSNCARPLPFEDPLDEVQPSFRLLSVKEIDIKDWIGQDKTGKDRTGQGD